MILSSGISWWLDQPSANHKTTVAQVVCQFCVPRNMKETKVLFETRIYCFDIHVAAYYLSRPFFCSFRGFYHASQRGTRIFEAGISCSRGNIPVWALQDFPSGGWKGEIWRVYFVVYLAMGITCIFPCLVLGTLFGKLIVLLIWKLLIDYGGQPPYWWKNLFLGRINH